MGSVRVTDTFNASADVILFEGDCLDLLAQVPDGLAKLVVTSPPYNPVSHTNLDLTSTPIWLNRSG